MRPEREKDGMGAGLIALSIIVGAAALVLLGMAATYNQREARRACEATPGMVYVTQRGAGAVCVAGRRVE